MTELYYGGAGSYGHFDLVSSIPGAAYFIPSEDLKKMDELVYEMSQRGKGWLI